MVFEPGNAYSDDPPRFKRKSEMSGDIQKESEKRIGLLVNSNHYFTGLDDCVSNYAFP